jgi:hypothetical protein
MAVFTAIVLVTLLPNDAVGWLENSHLFFVSLGAAQTGNVAFSLRTSASGLKSLNGTARAATLPKTYA